MQEIIASVIQNRFTTILGVPGIGKTTLAKIITAGYSYTPIELNASDVRNKKAVSNIVKTATSNVAVLASGTLSK